MSPFPLGILAASGVEAITPLNTSFDLIATTGVLSASESGAITFEQLSGLTDYQHLQLRGSVDSTDDRRIEMEFNSITTTIYDTHRLVTSAPNVDSTSNIGNSEFRFAQADNNHVTTFVSDILNFRDTTMNTTVRTISGNRNTTRFTSGAFKSTQAIDSIILKIYVAAFAAGTQISLYGMRSS